MSWIELSIEVPARRTEECTTLLEKEGASAVSYFDATNTPLLEPLPGTTPLWDCVKVVGLFSEETDLTKVQKVLSTKYPESHLAVAPLVEQDWSRTWLEHFHPIAFGERLWVCPLDHPLEIPEEQNAVILRLDPGLAFGTGTHPTTALCLSWLDKHPPVNQRIVDYGCGSGILGIAALLLGAEQVWAVDYDPQALISTRDNAEKNHITAQQCLTLTPEQFSPTNPFDLVLANILAEPLVTLAPTLSACCAPGGHIVLSGLLQTQIETVKAAYVPWFEFEECQIREEWVLLVARRLA